MMVAESGGYPGGQYIVASDARICESGYSQEPLYSALKYNVNPFDSLGAIWLRCVNTNDDARALLVEFDGIVPKNGRDLWYCVMIRYSIGRGAVRHVLRCVAAQAARSDPPVSLEMSIVEWANKTNLALPTHIQHWGRQTPAQIKMRLTSSGHRNRLTVAASFSPLDGPPGHDPTPERPAQAGAFPLALVRAAKILLRTKPKSTTDECKAVRAEVVAFARNLRRQVNAPKPPKLWRVMNYFSPQLVRYYDDKPDEARVA